ncbi:M23 family metallopeptidase [Salinibius halmophilus]|uniref:M23 family metallopeptidase n=1 Tax=Salinibius halmophilus TaxID=1853216 RepID=UPI0013141B42|nr:peptidoglycan DD-metalloendopeptidase family protein [Salinibius halmophilus]
MAEQAGTIRIPITVETGPASNSARTPADSVSVPTTVPEPGKTEPESVEESDILPAQLPTATPVPAPQYSVTEDKVRTGDTLSEIFERNRAGLANIYAVLANNDYKAVLRNLYPDQKLVFKKHSNGELHSFEYWPDLLTKHEFIFDDDIRYQMVEREPNVNRRSAHAVINSSLFLAGRDAGISENMTMDLAAIFGWDIDFILDIRQGDEFKVIWDEYEIDDTIIDTKIIAAQFTNDGDTFNAISFTDSDGRSSFYTPEGLSMRKAFIRTPVEFARISSPFNPNRRHPVLNTIRAHKGTDYAAPTGTPIKASGDGRVVFRGVKGGYGNTIIIQHGHNIRTLYAHMNGFARGIGNNDRVRQGQIIGYVGATGMVTGPHLHYEFLVNGVHRNPQTVDLPEAEPIANKYRADFQRLASPLLAQLNDLNLFASND